jgi:hypothetical protein
VMRRCGAMSCARACVACSRYPHQRHRCAQGVAVAPRLLPLPPPPARRVAFAPLCPAASPQLRPPSLAFVCSLRCPQIHSWKGSGAAIETCPRCRPVPAAARSLEAHSSSQTCERTARLSHAAEKHGKASDAIRC